MEEELSFLIESLTDDMNKAMAHLDKALLKIRAGRANPTMLEGIFVEYYGSQVKLQQVSNISTPDARTLFVQPFEKSLIQAIEKSIMYANLGFNPMNNGDAVIINIPPLTEDRRKELVRMARAEGEEAKVAIRSVRREGMDEAKRMEKDGMSEDQRKDLEAQIQALVDKHIALIDQRVTEKEGDILKL
ncbi:MAG: ribosome recycling factor [Bacteroidota bacterium]|jgi:ribosome recycling factor